MPKAFQDILHNQFHEDHEQDHSDLKTKMSAVSHHKVFLYDNNSPADANW